MFKCNGSGTANAYMMDEWFYNAAEYDITVP